MQFSLFDWYFIARVFPEECNYEDLVTEGEDGYDESLYPKRSTWCDAFIDFMDQVEPYLGNSSIRDLNKNCSIDYVLRDRILRLNFIECCNLAAEVGLLANGVVRRHIVAINEQAVVEAYKRKLPKTIFTTKAVFH